MKIKTSSLVKVVVLVSIMSICAADTQGVYDYRPCVTDCIQNVCEPGVQFDEPFSSCAQKCDKDCRTILDPACYASCIYGLKEPNDPTQAQQCYDKCSQEIARAPFN